MFIQQEGLTYIRKADIQPTPWSDHCATRVTMTSPLYRPARTSWRLNDSLLLDELLRAQIAKHVHQYFKENTTEGVSDMTLWEAHKSVMMGHLIRIARQKKKEAGQQLLDLT
ncbi:Hypothetical predicted protein [Pelobates cultripes]|uniref:Uncharacterized protein n=1 Tax=Pelobates cultripes TaxID=61616 RepID=A0AAD1W0P9_PELCU|nr:Hypothetical predicted protein [Pelobates cultripes]